MPTLRLRASVKKADSLVSYSGIVEAPRLQGAAMLLAASPELEKERRASLLRENAAGAVVLSLPEELGPPFHWAQVPPVVSAQSHRSNTRWQRVPDPSTAPA